MIKSYIFLIFTLITYNCNAQALDWVTSIGGSEYDHVYAIAVDKDKNVYTTGDFKGTIDFDPGTGVSNLTAVGSSDIFIQKLDSSGNLLWAKSMGGADPEAGFSIAVDSFGNVYTVGTFWSNTIDFNPGAGVSNLSSNGQEDIFIHKLDSSGNFVWAKILGGTFQDQAFSIVLDELGHIYIFGHYGNTVDFDPGIGQSIHTAQGGSPSFDAFLLKLDTAANFMWVETMGGAGNDFGLDLVLDDFGNIYGIGQTEGALDFDSGPGVHPLPSAGMLDSYVVKFDTLGNFNWANSYGGPLNDRSEAIIISSSGQIYISGQFRDTVDFDPGPGVSNYSSKGHYDCFVQKMDPLGNMIWTKTYGGTLKDLAKALALDNQDNIYVAGSYEGITTGMDFDPGPGIFYLNVGFFDNIFLQKLDSSGNFLNVKGFGGDGYDFVVDIQLVGNNDIYMTGTYTYIADFNPNNGVYTKTSNGQSDIFVMKLAPKCHTNNGVTVTNNVLIATLTPASYQWINCEDGTLIVNDTNQSFTPSNTGIYACIIDNGLCIDTSVCTSIIIGDLGITTTNQNVISIFPNPSTNYFIISFNGKAANNFVLTDVYGRKVIQFNHIKSGDKLNIEHMSPGIYVLKSITDQLPLQTVIIE